MQTQPSHISFEWQVNLSYHFENCHCYISLQIVFNWLLFEWHESTLQWEQCLGYSFFELAKKYFKSRWYCCYKTKQYFLDIMRILCPSIRDNWFKCLVQNNLLFCRTNSKIIKPYKEWIKSIRYAMNIVYSQYSSDLMIKWIMICAIINMLGFDSFCILEIWFHTD